jgi:hypothetical protein
MRFRQGIHRIDDDAEQPLAAEVRELASRGTAGAATDPPDAYWQNFPVRANARIDTATSGRALSISWAARVAIPGVVAIGSFLIGLHYYVPEPPRALESVGAVVLSLPASAMDSLLADPARVDASLSVAETGPDVFQVSRDQIADYLVVSGSPTAAVEGLSENETNDLLAVLGDTGSER